MKQGNFLLRFHNYYQTYGLWRLLKRSWGVALDSVGLGTHAQPLAALPGASADDQRASAHPVLILAGIEWAYRVQRAQQLARGFARAGSPVFYVEPVFTAARTPGWRMRALENEPNLRCIKFHAPGRMEVWQSEKVSHVRGQLKEELAAFIQALTRTWAHEPLILVQHPSWHCCLPENSKACVLYDCLDAFSDFSSVDSLIGEHEARLVNCVNGIVSTSQILDAKWSTLKIPHCIIRNGVDFTHFNTKPARCYTARRAAGIIGYHGAIEEWFDVALVNAVARAFPEYEITLIGGVGNSDARQALRKQKNIRLLGEIPYQSLPSYIHAFSVGIIPFTLRPLTRATNPIKVYEYLAAGIPVVSTPLPELQGFGDLVSMGNGDTFIEAIRRSLAPDSARAERGQLYAAHNSWKTRVMEFYTFHKSLIQGYK